MPGSQWLGSPFPPHSWHHILRQSWQWGLCADQACHLLLAVARNDVQSASHICTAASRVLGEQLPCACREAQKEVEILDSKLQRVDKARASEASSLCWLLVLLVLSSNLASGDSQKQLGKSAYVCMPALQQSFQMRLTL